MKSQPEKFLSVKVLAAAACLGMILASACLFEPREPSEPSGEQVQWIRPIEPENVLSNMRAAVNAQQRTNYENSLGDEFVFLPGLQAAGEAPPGYFDEFDKRRELGALDKLFTQADSLHLEWNFDPNTDLTMDGTDAAEVILDNYELFVDYTEGEERIFQGSTKLYLEYIGEPWHQWFLVGWDESEFNDAESWGLLRAILDVRSGS